MRLQALPGNATVTLQAAVSRHSLVGRSLEITGSSLRALPSVRSIELDLQYGQRVVPTI
jgi:hypothetical protein